MPAYLGFSEAKKCLDDKHGDKFLLAQSYLKNLDQRFVVKSDDVKWLDEFTTFLIGCRNAMLSTDNVKELFFPSSLRLIVSKLFTGSLVSLRWCYHPSIMSCGYIWQVGNISRARNLHQAQSFAQEGSHCRSQEEDRQEQGCSITGKEEYQVSCNRYQAIQGCCFIFSVSVYFLRIPSFIGWL